MSKKILIIGGEASGDKHGALLIKALKEIEPTIEVCGMGGPEMLSAGLKGLDSTSISVMGIVEVIARYGDIKKAFNKLLEMLDGDKDIKGVVLIDYPEFNLRFAKEVKKRSIPVIYYVSPQVWAWREHRKYKIAQVVTKMLVILPFEENLYSDVGLDTEFVGHPLAEEVKCSYSKDEAREKLGVTSYKAVVAILPGSRAGEISRILPKMLEGVNEFEKDNKGTVFLIPKAEGIDREVFENFIKHSSADIRIIEKDYYTVLRASDAALVTSGTATLETAIMGVPMAICYKVNALTYAIGKMLVRVKHIGLPNIIADKSIVKEFIQGDLNKTNIADELKRLLFDESYIKEIKKEIEAVGLKLTEKGNSADRAAQAILKTIN